MEVKMEVNWGLKLILIAIENDDRKDEKTKSEEDTVEVEKMIDVEEDGDDEEVDEEKYVVKSDAGDLSARAGENDNVDEDEVIEDVETEEPVVQTAGDSQYEVQEPKEDP